MTEQAQRVGMLELVASLPTRVGYALRGRIATIALGADSVVRFMSVIDANDLDDATARMEMLTALRAAMDNNRTAGGTAIVIGYDLPEDRRIAQIATVTEAVSAAVTTSVQMVVENDYAARITRGQIDAWSRLPEVQQSASFTTARLAHGSPAASRQAAAAAWTASGTIEPSKTPCSMAGVHAAWAAVFEGNATNEQVSTALMAIESKHFRDLIVSAVLGDTFAAPAPGPVPTIIAQAIAALERHERDERLRAIVQATHPARCAQVCSMVAMIQLGEGKGFPARVLVEQALAADPGHTLAGLLQVMLVNGIPMPPSR